MVGLVLAAGFGGVVRCEIGVLPVDLLAETSLDVVFDDDADFCEMLNEKSLKKWMVTHQVTVHV